MKFELFLLRHETTTDSSCWATSTWEPDFTSSSSFHQNDVYKFSDKPYKRSLKIVICGKKIANDSSPIQPFSLLLLLLSSKVNMMMNIKN